MAKAEKRRLIEQWKGVRELVREEIKGQAELDRFNVILACALLLSLVEVTTPLASLSPFYV